MKKLRRVCALLMAVALFAAVVSCKKEITAEDLMTNIEAGNASESSIDDAFCQKYASSAFTLLRNEFMQNDGNVVISPLGAYYNLAMLANGASDQTLTELENMFGKSYDRDDINVFMHSYTENMKNSDASKLYFENGIWFNADKNAAPTDEFLTAVKTYYGVSAYRESFGKEAANNINNWASNMTDMYAEYLLNDVPAEHPMYLVNTTLLDADWEAPISPENVMEGSFTNAKSQKETVQVMSSYEQIYVGNEMYEGFIKPYSGGEYAFLAVIPKYNKDNALIEMISYFTNGSYYCSLVNGHKARTIDAGIPKFSCEYKGGVKRMLEGVNLGTAFHSSYARFNALGTADGNLYAGDFYVSTGLSVTERGTSKGSGAKVGDSLVATNVISISLDHPFVFAVVDTKNYMPIILGAVNTIKG